MKGPSHRLCGKEPGHCSAAGSTVLHKSCNELPQAWSSCRRCAGRHRPAASRHVRHSLYRYWHSALCIPATCWQDAPQRGYICPCRSSSREWQPVRRPHRSLPVCGYMPRGPSCRYNGKGQSNNAGRVPGRCNSWKRLSDLCRRS